MKQNCRKLAAFILVMTIVIASPGSVSAEMEESSKTGTGKVEGVVNTDVYQVVLPTVSEHTFDFIIDPTKMIEQTNGVRYGGKTFEKNSTLFFRRTDKEKKEDYSSVSNPITIINKSSIPIDVSMNVSMPSSLLSGIQLSEDKDFKGNSDASLYMAVVNGNHITPVGVNGVSIATTLDAAPKDAFEYIYNKERGKYAYVLKKSLDSSIFSTYSFQITGAANENGDWSEFAEASPQIRVTWKITQKNGMQEKH